MDDQSTDDQSSRATFKRGSVPQFGHSAHSLKAVAEPVKDLLYRQLQIGAVDTEYGSGVKWSEML